MASAVTDTFPPTIRVADSQFEPSCVATIHFWVWEDMTNLVFSLARWFVLLQLERRLRKTPLGGYPTTRQDQFRHLISSATVANSNNSFQRILLSTRLTDTPPPHIHTKERQLSSFSATTNFYTSRNSSIINSSWIEELLHFVSPRFSYRFQSFSVPASERTLVPAMQASWRIWWDIWYWLQRR